MSTAKLHGSVAIATALACAACYRHTPSVREVGTTQLTREAPTTYVETTSTERKPLRGRGPSAIFVGDDVETACGIGTRPGAFEHGSAELRDAGEDLLRDVAACLKTGALDDGRLEIVSVTDGAGDGGFQLGRARALAARSYLLREGVEGDAVDIRARVDRRPRAAAREHSIELHVAHHRHPR